MNHSPRFWDVVRSVMPEYADMREQLNTSRFQTDSALGAKTPYAVCTLVAIQLAGQPKVVQVRDGFPIAKVVWCRSRDG